MCLCWWAVSPQGHRVSVVREEQLEGVRWPGSRLLFRLLLLFFAVIIPWSCNVNGRLCFAEVKSRMSLVVSVHVYSVQRAFLKDSGPLYSVDYDAVKENLQNCSRSQFCATIFTSHERQSHFLTLYVTSCLQLWCHPLFGCSSHVLSGATAGQRGPSSSWTWTRTEKAQYEWRG